MIEISPKEARDFVLHVQGLRTKKPSRSSMSVVNRIHNVQIDTISVVSRSHNLIIFNRYPKYKEGTIWGLLKQGKLFEHWSHAACLLPIETYPFYAWRMSFFPEDLWTSFRKWGSENRQTIEAVYKKVKKEGPTSSASIGKRKKKSDGWWDWKAEKRALEYLYTTGRLMVSHRINFQKYYDLTERVLPPNLSTEPISSEEAAEFVVDVVLRSLGLGSAMDLRTYLGGLPARKLWNGRSSQVEVYLDRKIADNRVEEVSIEGIRTRYFMHATMKRQMDAAKFIQQDTPVKFLTPFDNILRERHYPAELWNFDYRIECYTPADKRKYGYFTLPILDMEKLVGRVDAKIHRSEKIMEFKSLYLEDDFWKSSDGLARFVEGVKLFSAFHGAEYIKLGKVIPKRAKDSLKDAMDI